MVGSGMVERKNAEWKEGNLIDGSDLAKNPQIFDRAAGDEVFLDDAFEVCRGAGVIPHAFGVNHCNRALRADAQAIRLGARDAAVVGHAEFLQPLFEKLPRNHAGFMRAAFGFRLVRAQKNMAADDIQANSSGECLDFGGHEKDGLEFMLGLH
jgi:hypothetical protein